MKKGHALLRGTIILTLSGLISRLIGFFYRIFLSHKIGAEGMGIYQLIFPVYTLCFALTIWGIQTALSRYLAADLALSNTRKANDTFFLGTGASCLLSLCASFFLYKNAAWIGTVLLGDSRTIVLLQLLCWSIPLGAVHTCASAYYYARKKAEIPAISQLLEQTIRVASSYLFYKILLSKGLEPNATIAVFGMIAGEFASSLYCVLLISWNLHNEKYHILQIQKPIQTLRKIFSLAIPVTGNKVLLASLTSIENILIPNRLRLYGLSNSDALSLFGILTGMALPLLLFPSTITNSLSVMLLPSVAEQQAMGKHRQIQDTVKLVSQGCLFLGCVCFLGFFFLGKPIGMLLFHNQLVGDFLRSLAFLCPFLYLNTTLMSVLNGLGKTTSCLIHNLAALAIRIAFTYFGIPILGLKGYLYGLLLGEFLLTALNVFALVRLSVLGRWQGK